MIPYPQTAHAATMRDIHARLAPVETGAKLLERLAVLFSGDADLLALVGAVQAAVDDRLEAFDAEFVALDRDGAVLVQQVAA